MPINPFPESVEKQVIRIRDGLMIGEFRKREFQDSKLKYFGMPSAELLDILAWEDHISSFTAVERDSDVVKDIEKTIFENKFESISQIVPGDVNQVLKSQDIGKHQLFNLDFYGGFVHLKDDGSASIPDALKSLIRRQATYRESFMLLSTFNLRDDDKVEYDDYISTIYKNLSRYNVKFLDKNIDFHIKRGSPTNVYKLKICLPCFVYTSGLPEFRFELKGLYHYKSLVHFAIEMRFIKDRALGVVPNAEDLISILNTQIHEVRGRVPTVKEPRIPEVVLITN